MKRLRALRASPPTFTGGDCGDNRRINIRDAGAGNSPSTCCGRAVGFRNIRLFAGHPSPPM
jgi:hypothetical protein